MYYARNPYARIGQLPLGIRTPLGGVQQRLNIPAGRAPAMRAQVWQEIQNAIAQNVDAGWLVPIARRFNQAARLDQTTDYERRPDVQRWQLWFGYPRRSDFDRASLEPMGTFEGPGGLEPLLFALSSYAVQRPPTIFAFGPENEIPFFIMMAGAQPGGQG